MTPELRDLTPFEAARLEHYRVTFSGRPDLLAELEVDEVELRSTPVPPDCPPWCGLDAGHTYDTTDTAETTELRFHELTVGRHVIVCQEEQRTTEGIVTRLQPYVSVLDTERVQFDATTAAVHAGALLSAAAKLREIGGAR